MATKEKKNYSVSNKNMTITAEVATLGEKDLAAVKNYVALGYKLINKKVAKSLTIDEMRAKLAADEETLKKFNEAYAKKTKGKKEFKETGFAEACKIYNAWKKENNKK